MKPTEVNYLIVPGWNGSPENHWQSHWHRTLPCAQRVEQSDWQWPCLQRWIAQLEQDIRALPGQVVLIAHSLGCITLAHWASQAGKKDLASVCGALLVAPADVEREGCPQPLVSFAPVPLQQLPFPSVLVGSDSDHAASRERALEFAGAWGSEPIILQGAGHINVESGHRHWEEGFAYLDRLLSRGKEYEGLRCA